MKKSSLSWAFFWPIVSLFYSIVLLVMAESCLANPALNLAILDQRLSPTASSLSDQPLKKPSLELTVRTPASLMIADNEIHWVILASGVPIHSLTGFRQSLNLLPGSYVIELSIGEYKERQPVTIKQATTLKPYFRAELGRLEIKSSEAAAWTLSGNSKELFSYPTNHYLNILVPAGTYALSSTLDSVQQQRRINVVVGKTSSFKWDIPVGRLSLIATQDNRPLFHSMEWDLYRLDQQVKHYIGTHYLHAQTLTIPPGRYEVIAKHKGKVLSRQFRVQENTDNRVILALD